MVHAGQRVVVLADWSRLAEGLPGPLLPLDEAASLEVTAIHSVAGTLTIGAPLLTRPPYERPHVPDTSTDPSRVRRI
jgi:hypothetical protein